MNKTKLDIKELQKTFENMKKEIKEEVKTYTYPTQENLKNSKNNNIKCD